MIELTAQDGGRIAVNADLIWHVRHASGEQTAIYAPTGAAIFVQEKYEDVLTRIEESRSASC